MHGDAPEPLLVRVQASLTPTPREEGPAPTGRFHSWISRRPLVGVVWALSLPIVLVETSETIIHVINTAFLARVGTTEVAAIGLADSIFELWLVPTIGLVEAMQILIARRAGEGSDRGVGDTFNRGLLLVTLLSLALTAALDVASPHLAAHLVTEAHVATEVDGFLRIAAFAITFNAAGLAFGVLYIGLERTRVLLGAAVVLATTNVALDWLLILGKLGIPPMGIRGAAVGAVGAEAATCLYLAIHTLRRRDLARYALFRRAPGGGALSVSLARLGSPVALQALLEGAGWLVFFLIVEGLGEGPLAWSNIVYTCFVVLLVPVHAFSETACSMVSSFIGRGEGARIRVLMRSVVMPAYLLSVPLLLVGLVFPERVVSLFTSEPSVVVGSTAPLRVVVAAMVAVIAAELWFAAVFGTGDTDAALVIEFLRTVAMVGCAWLAAIELELTLPYVWLSVPAAWASCLALSFLWVRGGFWSRREV